MAVEESTKLQVHYVPLKELKQNPKNRNKHSKDQIERMIKLIEYQGFRDPIIVSNLSGMIVAGHGRYQAAKKMKLKEVPVSYQDFKDDDQELAFQISHNAISEWSELDFSGINDDVGSFDPSFDLELLGIRNFTIDVADKEELTDPDSIPEKVEPKAKLGDIYQLGEHRLMCGDSTNIQHVELLLEGYIPDMVYTDPPYGVEVVKANMVGANFGVAKKGNYKPVAGDSTTEVAKEFYSTCKAANLKNFIIWGGNYFTDFLEPKNSWVVWNKRGDTSIVNTFADGELAWSDIGFPLRIHSQLWNGMIRSGEKDKRVHPTQKPTALAEFCFELVKDCKSVYDGFLGSGSALIACEKTNRKCYGFELDPHYVSVIIERWCKYTGQEAYLLDEKGKTSWTEVKGMGR